MYYTIEGKRFLGILYAAGLIAGTLFINASIKTGLFRASDLLGFVDYVKTLENETLGTFFSYVLLVRLRQIFVFFICMFLFSPYVVFCVLDFAVSAILGIFLSVMVIRFGWIGLPQGLLFLFPHYIFYGLMFLVMYVYLFRRTPLSQIYRVSYGIPGRMSKDRRLLEYRLLVALFCLLMFGLGCYTEGYINPELLKVFFAG